MAGARAAVVADQEETLVAEALHDLDHVLRHDPKAVIDQIGAGVGQRAVAIAAQIGEHHVIALGEPRRDAVPQHVIVRIAVQQQHRRAGAAMAQADDGALGADVEMLEAREQRRDLGAAPAGRIARIIGGGRLRQHRRLLRGCRRGDARGRGARRQGLNQTAAAHAVFAAFGLKMPGHLNLPALAEGYFGGGLKYRRSGGGWPSRTGISLPSGLTA